MNTRHDNCLSNSYEEINLLYVWKKIIRHKKIFLYVFFTIFIIGGVKVLLTASKYTFSQRVEVAEFTYEKERTEQERQDARDAIKRDVIKRMKKIFFPMAMHAYNLQAAQKMYLSESSLMVENLGSNVLLLSMNGKLKNLDAYKFILQKVIDYYANDAKEYNDKRKEELIYNKSRLEQRLAVLNVLRDAISKKYLIDIKKQKDFGSLEDKVIAIYLSDQGEYLVALSKEINLLQEKILGINNAKVASELIVSGLPIGPSKQVLLILVVMAALFFAFVGVFVADFIFSLKKHS